MRFLSIWHANRKVAENGPAPEMITEMNKFVDELTQKGILVATGGRPASGDHVKVRNRGGEVTVVDGPFAEAKEVVGGFALLELPSLEAAVEMAKRFIRIAGEGESEIYALMDGRSPDRT